MTPFQAENIIFVLCFMGILNSKEDYQKKFFYGFSLLSLIKMIVILLGGKTL